MGLGVTECGLELSPAPSQVWARYSLFEPQFLEEGDRQHLSDVEMQH
jgi:hypothetical protein